MLALVPLLAAPRPALAQQAGSEERANPHTATGTMSAYDPETRQLTVTSVSGSTTFHLATDARVWLGRKRLPVSQLKTRVGAQVTVSWSEAEGVRTTHTVRVAVEPPQEAF
jgi:phage baseplate assembly protein gpV